MDRRDFLRFSAGSVAASVLPATTFAQPTEHARFKAIAFDALPIFDLRPIAALTESLFPGNGLAITSIWRTKQFEYQWLRALSGHYADFLQATEQSLLFAAEQLQLHISADKQQQLMSAYSSLDIWPDVPATIEILHNAGLRLAFLSNMTEAMLHDGLMRAGLEKSFEAILSTDQIRTYKPDPRAYQMAIDKLQLPHEQILFVAFAGWDAAGAKWFGYPTFWVDRLGSPMENLGVEADALGRDLHALVRFALSSNSQKADSQKSSHG